MSKKYYTLKSIIFLSTVWLLGSLTASFGDCVWPQDNSDLKPDPTVIFGCLNNGFRYAIKPNAEPPKRVSLRLYVNAGSLMESDREQGIAHYLEHLEFEGSKHFPPGEMIKYFQRIGMSHGADTNAHTWLDETVYKLDLPDNTGEYLNDAFTVLQDFAGGLQLHEAIIDRERGVILAEKRQRDSVNYRTYVAQMNFLFKGTLIPERLPIGLEETIRSFTLPDFQYFYDKWYVPERMLLVVVGEVNPKEIEQYIEKYFSPLSAKGVNPKNPYLDEIAHRQEANALLHYEPESDETNIALHNVIPVPYKHDSKERFIEELSVSVANAIMDRRFDILSKQEDAPFSMGASYTTEIVNTWLVSGIELTCQPHNWEKCLILAERQLRMALNFGFSNAEFKEAKAVILNEFAQNASHAKTKLSARVAHDLLNNISSGRVHLSPEQQYELAKEAFTTITPASVADAFRRVWHNHHPDIFISGNLSLTDPEKRILEVYKNSQGVEVSAPTDKELSGFQYTSFGEPGKVANISYQEDLDIYQIRFQNNVYLNLKSTPFEANTIKINVRFGGGLLEAIRTKPGLDKLANITFINGGLQKHSLDELITIFAGKTVEVNFNVHEDAFEFAGQTTPQDLRDQLNLIMAYILEPGYRNEALWQARKAIEQLYIVLTNTPEGVMQNQVARLIASNDNRFGFPEKSVLLSYTMEDLRNWLSPPLADSFMEISIVGDFEVETVIQEVARTFGTLPDRKKSKVEYAQERVVQFPENIHEKTFPVESDIPKALVAIYWPTDDGWDISQARKLSVLSSIIDERLRLELREKMGETYTSFTVSEMSDTFTRYGYLLAISIVDPGNIDSIAEATLKISRDLFENGISQDEFERAINPAINQIKVSSRDNKYWLNTVLASSVEYPQQLDWARSRLPEFLSFTANDIMAVARKFLVNKDALTVKILPVGNHLNGKEK